MRLAVALAGLLLPFLLAAAPAPKVAPGDFLLVWAQVRNCGSAMQAIDVGKVDGNGTVTLFSDVSLAAGGKPVYLIRDDLLDAMEKRTGHRSETLEIEHLPGSDEQAAATRLVAFGMMARSGCLSDPAQRPDRRPAPDPDTHPDWLIHFDRLVRADNESRAGSPGLSG